MTTTAIDHPAFVGGSPTEHWFSRLGRFSARRRKPVMLVWLLIALAAAPLAITLNGALSGAGWEAQGSIAQRVRDELRSNFPQVGAEAAIVVVHQPTPFSAHPPALNAVVKGLTGAEGVKAVKVVRELALEHNVAMPIAAQVYAVCHEGRSPEWAQDSLLRGRVGHEAGVRSAVGRRNSA